MSIRQTLVLCALAASLSGASQAQVQAPADVETRRRFVPPIRVNIPGPMIQVVDPVTGEGAFCPSEYRWSYMCGSDTSRQTKADLERIAAEHAAAFAPGQPVTIVDTTPIGPTTRATNFNLIFTLAGTVPAEAIPAFQRAEQYLESKFTDPITITVTVGYANMGGGVIGATGPLTIQNVTYATTRNALINGQDTNDTIQDFLPLTSVPVRYDGTSDTITNETFVDWSYANAKSAGVTTGNQVSASMTYNTLFTFDYDPTNGIVAAAISMVDTVVHETGHAMGFVSGNDYSPTTRFIETMDLFRFQRTNGATTFNPTTTANFQTLPRLVCNNSPNDDHILDFVSIEYRMSDGNPWQGSHFREQTSNIGLMDPAENNGQTNHPNYFKTSDLTVFDAIGWDDAQPCSPTISAQPPTSIAGVAGQLIQIPLTATATGGGGTIAYQWRRNNVNLPTTNTRFTGINTNTLRIDPVADSDDGAFDCVITNTCGTITSNDAVLAIGPRCVADRDNGLSTGRPDGAVDIADLLYYIEMFEAGSPAADLDNGNFLGVTDGAVEIGDLLFMLMRFEAGC